MQKVNLKLPVKHSRPVTGLSWGRTTKINTRLFLVGYGAREGEQQAEADLTEPDGVIEVFELVKEKQEHKVKNVATLNCHYTLTNAFFSPWEPNIVFGSSKSGDIFKWDLKKE